MSRQTFREPTKERGLKEKGFDKLLRQAGLILDQGKVRAQMAWDSVRITVFERGTRVINSIPPLKLREQSKLEWPDFVGRARSITGGRTTGENAVLEERATHKW
jgi:hypothetical protein